MNGYRVIDVPEVGPIRYSSQCFEHVTAYVAGPGLPVDACYAATFATYLDDVGDERKVWRYLLGECGVHVLDGDAKPIAVRVSDDVAGEVEGAASEAAQDALDRAFAKIEVG